MKKMDLCKLALLGITLGLTTSSIQAHTNDINDISNQTLADAGDRYICSSYQNCGKCGGSCNIKNPKTPGFTPEEIKQAEEYQKEHAKEKEGAKDGPSAPGQEKCGTFCASTSGNSTSSDDNSSTMKAKRNTLRDK